MKCKKWLSGYCRSNYIPVQQILYRIWTEGEFFLIQAKIYSLMSSIIQQAKHFRLASLSNFSKVFKKHLTTL